MSESVILSKGEGNGTDGGADFLALLGEAPFAPQEQFIIAYVHAHRRLLLSELMTAVKQRNARTGRKGSRVATVRGRIKTIQNRARLWQLPWSIGSRRSDNGMILTWEVREKETDR